MDDVLLYFAMKYEGDFKRMFVALKTKEIIDSQKSKKKQLIVHLLFNNTQDKTILKNR